MNKQTAAAGSTSAAKSRFQWEDPFLLEAQLSDEERMIRDTARAYVQDKLMPRVTSAFADERTDREIFTEMGGSCELTEYGLVFTGSGAIHGIDVDLSEVGELTPGIAAVAALADSPRPGQRPPAQAQVQ